MKNANRRKKIIIHLALFTILAFWMIPLIYAVSVSLRSPSQVFNPTLFVLPASLDNFILVIRDNPIFLFFLNSLIITACTVCIVLIAASTFAYAVAVLKLKTTTVIYAVLLTTLMVPIVSLVLPLAMLIKTFGWVNRYLGLILPYAALGTPFAIVVLKSFMEDTAYELFDAATMDGANNRQIFLHICIPVIKPAIYFVAIWQFIVTWNEFFLALIILTKEEMKTLTIVPMQYSGQYMANPGALFAILVLIALPLILLYIFIQRIFIAGLISGSVKG